MTASAYTIIIGGPGDKLEAGAGAAGIPPSEEDDDYLADIPLQDPHDDEAVAGKKTQHLRRFLRR